jgi:ubiquinone/menaquinone biosynthesis C-methylase UbiE
MGFYAKYILPRLIDLAMRNKDAAHLRAECVPRAQGKVLEIGIGSGLNLPYYSSQVQHVCGVDPSSELQRMAARKIAAVPFEVSLFPQSAEDRLPLGDQSIDTVLMTWSLCSIPNPEPALSEIRRVLKASGRLIFVEHGRSPDAKVMRWQRRLTPVWKRIAGGCHLDRRIDELISGAGFKISDLQTFYLPGPHPMTYTYKGWAQVSS